MQPDDIGEGRLERAAPSAKIEVPVLHQLAGQPSNKSPDSFKNQDADQAVHMLRALIDCSSEAIIGNDVHGYITSWNTSAARIFGYSAAEALGASMTRLLPSDGDMDVGSPGRETTADDAPGRLSNRRRNKDGRMIEVATTESPIRDAGGQHIGVAIVFRDLSKETHTAKALRSSELRFRRLFESAKDGILILDAETGVVVDVNPFLTSMLGFSHEHFIGKAIWDLGFFRDVLANEQNFVELKKTGYLRHENLPLQAANGRRIEVEFISNVYLVDGERVIQCNVRDVTARRHAEEALRLLTVELEERVMQRTAELQATNKELEAFSYSVSHDLRAPLRAVDGFAQAVLEDYGPQLPEEARRYLLTIREGTQTMGVLIDDLLTFSRLGRATLIKQEVDTATLIRGVLDEQRAEFAGRQIDVRIGVMPASPADPALLKQVWINLLSNALKFTRRRERAVVEIGCEFGAQGTVYFVRDNGTGFDMRYE
jgi:PAS domain S-box-containing protein